MNEFHGGGESNKEVTNETMREPRVDFHEANVLADEVVRGQVSFNDAKHRLFQYWETRISPRQAEHKLRRCVDAMTEQESARYGKGRRVGQ